MNGEGTILFVKNRDMDYIPTLRLLHQFPFMMAQQQVDKGAIKFILSGSHIMCPGLTSAGARMTPDVPRGAMVAVMAEGREHALAIGLMKMSTDEIRSINEDVAIDNVPYLNDGLWRTTQKL